jgi:hypothetical protein
MIFIAHRDNCQQTIFNIAQLKLLYFYFPMILNVFSLKLAPVLRVVHKLRHGLRGEVVKDIVTTVQRPQ